MARAKLKTVERTLAAALSPGIVSAIKLLRAELGLAYRHRKGTWKAAKFKGSRGLKINFGSGQAVKPGWVNVDLNKEADLALDLRRPLPFDTGSCSMVYTEHFLEHLEYPNAAFQFLRECFRILEPGGLFSLGVPDTEWYMLDYCGVENTGRREAGFTDEDTFSIAKRLWHPKWCQTRMEHLHFHSRQGHEHQFAYDCETLERALLLAGFDEVKRRPFDPGLDSKGRALNTLYMQARHPAGANAPADAEAKTRILSAQLD